MSAGTVFKNEALFSKLAAALVWRPDAQCAKVLLTVPGSVGAKRFDFIVRGHTLFELVEVNFPHLLHAQ
jgi:hypothetical protein